METLTEDFARSRDVDSAIEVLAKHVDQITPQSGIDRFEKACLLSMIAWNSIWLRWSEIGSYSSNYVSLLQSALEKLLRVLGQAGSADGRLLEYARNVQRNKKAIDLLSENDIGGVRKILSSDTRDA